MRLIDADALKISTEFSEDGEYSWDIVPAFRIKDAPTIDAVPVVRCENCKHPTDIKNERPFGFMYKCGGVWHGGEWYCPLGERSEE